jgi:hypothetical protein
MRMTNVIPLECSLLLLVGTLNSNQTLKANQSFLEEIFALGVLEHLDAVTVHGSLPRLKDRGI